MPNTLQGELDQFMQTYEKASNSHRFSNVQPLLSSDAVYFFSDETLYGLEKIQQAFESTWNKIKEEVYHIEDLKWLVITPDFATCIYRFRWHGVIEDQEKEGEGRGTNILLKSKDGWKIVHEHLTSD